MHSCLSSTQVLELDQWLKRIYPNEKTHQVEGFNVPELMTLEDVNIMVYM